MAFAVTDYVTGEVKDNPKYVKWYGMLYDTVDGETTYHQVPLHPCT